MSDHWIGAPVEEKECLCAERLEIMFFFGAPEFADREKGWEKNLQINKIPL